MKTMIIIMALTGFTAISSYAQNMKCTCTHKTVHHNYHKMVQKEAETQNAVAPNDWARTYRFVKVEEPCFQYRKHNIVVTECPGTFYDNSDLNGYSSESSYMGYYPMKVQDKPNFDVPLAPQQNTLERSKVAPAGGNEFNTGYCPK